ncbi:DUF3078 domain-containing protein [Compostibacter hankyongensis]|uniref:DUF3078 domain-containing protein n=1 Tax=Compostibacter hankyongensis TaxID=1007089 RepID=A0ABP8FI00_9BACT
MKKYIACVAILLFLGPVLSAQVINYPPATSEDSGYGDTTGLPVPQEMPIDTLQLNAPIEEAPSGGFVPMIEGRHTEIKQQPNYDPRAVMTELNKGKYGKPIDTSKEKIHWRKGGTFALNISQGSLSNWAAGGDHFSIAAGSVANLYANFAKKRHSWDNNIDLAFGYLNTTSLGTRKSDDKIDFYSKYGFRFARHWSYSAMISFRSQFANGYQYPDDSTVISHFLAPGYVLASLGVDFRPAPYFSLLLSPLTSRFVIVADQRLANQGAYGVDSAHYIYLPGGNSRLMLEKGKMLRYEFGAFLSAQFNKEIMKNITWVSRLDLYSNYFVNPQNIDVDWTSLLTLKVNKYITATLNTELIYDDDVKFITYATNADGSIIKDPETGEGIILRKTARTQFKELIGLGFAYTF